MVALNQSDDLCGFFILLDGSVEGREPQKRLHTQPRQLLWREECTGTSRLVAEMVGVVRACSRECGGHASCLHPAQHLTRGAWTALGANLSPQGQRVLAALDMSCLSPRT